MKENDISSCAYILWNVNQVSALASNGFEMQRLTRQPLQRHVGE